MKTTATAITHIIGFNVNGCSSIDSLISSRPSTSEASFEDFRTDTILIRQIVTTTTISGTAQNPKFNPSYS